MAMLCGPAPALNGESGVRARSPAAVMANAEIVPLAELARYKNLPAGSEMMVLLPCTPGK